MATDHSSLQLQMIHCKAGESLASDNTAPSNPIRKANNENSPGSASSSYGRLCASTTAKFCSRRPDAQGAGATSVLENAKPADRFCRLTLTAGLVMHDPSGDTE